MNLTKLLTSHEIDTTNWSHKQGNKTLADLQSEIDRGESRLEIVEGDLLRLLRVVGLWVYVYLGEQLFRVVEDKQIFFTGAVRQRQLVQLTEKMQSGEKPLAAGRRLLQEELGFRYEGDFKDLGQETHCLESDSYPGLNSRYELFNYEVFLTAANLSELRFAEVQGHKICLFTLERFEPFSTQSL
jgi:hypothetical protein